MRNLNIGRTNHYFRKKRVLPALSPLQAAMHECGQQLIHTKPGFCSFAIICKSPPWTHWHGKHFSLRTLKRWIAKHRHAPAPTEISGKPPIGFNGSRTESPFSGSENPAVSGLFGAHAALKVCSFRAFQNFSHLLDSMATQHHHQAFNTEMRFYY